MSTASSAAAAAASSSSATPAFPSTIISPVDIAAKAAGDRMAEQSRALNDYIVAQVRYRSTLEERELNECQRRLDLWKASITAADTAVQNAIKVAVDESFLDTRIRFLHPAVRERMIKKNYPPSAHIPLINAFSKMYFQPDVQSAITNVFTAIKSYADENERKYDEDHPVISPSCQLL